MVPVHNIFRTSRKWGSSYKGGILLLLLIIDLRPARTVEKDYNSSEHYDPYRINFQRNSNSQNKSDSIRSNDWKPVLYNETGYRRMYLTRVNVFESQKISNKTDLVQKSTGNKQDDNKKLPDLFRTLRLANHKELENFSDDNDDNSRQKKRYRHSKRVRVIKPPHFLVPPQKDEQPIAPDNEARQFYRVYQTQYTKTPGYKSSEESSRESNWKTEDDKRDSTRRNPRTKKIRRKPINYLRPPVITLTTTEHIFFIKPKETTPMSFIDNHPPSNNEEMNRTTERNIPSEGPTSSSGENNITKPIKYRVMYPTTTEMNFIDETSQNSYPVYNTSDVFYSSFTPKTYNFANSPVTVYSMNDIFGLGDVPSKDFSIKSVKSVMNESSTSIYDNSKFMESNNSGRDGRYYNEQKSIESGGVYVVDPPNFSKDKEDFWSTDNFGKQSYRGSGTASSPYQGIEISTINYKNLETTSGDLSALNTGRTFGSSENSTSYGGSSTIASYRGSEKYAGPEMTTKFENLEATLRGSGTNYRGEDMRTSHRGSVSSTNYGGPVPSTISYRDQEISTIFRDPVSSTTSYRDKEIRTNYRGRESSLRYGGPETSTGYRSTGTTPAYKYPSPTTSPLIYSDEVWKTSSYIPDDSRSSFYITNSYKPTENKPSTLSDIQSGILIHEINDMIPNTTVSINENLGEVLEHTESYFESTKMDRNLMSPEVQKTGMTVSKLGDSNPVLNKSGDGLHQWIARFNPEEGGFRSSGRSKYGVDNSFDYQDSNFINPADRQVKLHVAESSHFRKGQTVEKALLLQQNNVIPGEAGSDYPILSKPPHNSRFMCKADGLRYVADVSSGCQVFYMCVGEGPGEPMLCPNGTLFSQDFLVCDWWYNVECRYKK